MVHQAELALENADVALFVVDAQEGLTSNDLAFAQWLRNRMRKSKADSSSSGNLCHLQVVLVANKCEASKRSVWCLCCLRCLRRFRF